MHNNTLLHPRTATRTTRRIKICSTLCSFFKEKSSNCMNIWRLRTHGGLGESSFVCLFFGVLSLCCYNIRNSNYPPVMDLKNQWPLFLQTGFCDTSLCFTISKFLISCIANYLSASPLADSQEEQPAISTGVGQLAPSQPLIKLGQIRDKPVWRKLTLASQRKHTKEAFVKRS